MSIINYFFIGFVFTFFIDLIFNKSKNHPKLIDKTWGWKERMVCTLIWPIAVVVFAIAYIKTYLQK